MVTSKFRTERGLPVHDEFQCTFLPAGNNATYGNHAGDPNITNPFTDSCWPLYVRTGMGACPSIRRQSGETVTHDAEINSVEFFALQVHMCVNVSTLDG